jgi:tRNA(Ile)-lysidine synthase
LPFSLGKLQQERSSGQSPEDFFRTQRERFLHSVATDIGASRILTGHTRNDQAETVLLNLLFGAGKRGLGGMPPARWRVARPLIDRSREETEAFCTALGITPCQDETNTDPAYRRNEVRLDLMPRLKDMEPRIVEHLAQLADVQRGEDYFLDAAAAQAVPITESDEGTSAMVSDLAAAAEPLRRRAIRLLARNENLGLSFSQCEQIARLVLDGEDGSGLDLGGGLSARRQAGLLTVGRDRQDAASS